MCMLMMKFSDLPIGTCFLCAKGKFKKIKNGPDRFEGNAVGVTYPRTINLNGLTLCKVLEEN